MRWFIGFFSLQDVQGDGSSLVVASNVMIIDNFLYLPFHGSLSNKTVCLYSHNLPDMFVMIFMEFTEEKAMVSLLFIQYLRGSKSGLRQKVG